MDESNLNRSKGQTSKPCRICQKGGRTIGRLGSIELNYCGHHRKYGERVLNYLICSLLRDKMTKFLKDAKESLFKENIPKLSDESYKAMSTYVDNMIKKLDELKLENLTNDLEHEIKEEDIGNVDE